MRTSPTANTDDVGTISGHVVSSEDGTGVPGAQLVFAVAEGPVSVGTDGEGRFRFAPRAPGAAVLVQAEAPGFLPYRGPESGAPVFDVLRGVAVEGVRIPLEPLRQLVVRVVDGEDPAVDGRGREPVAGAVVRVLEGTVRSPASHRHDGPLPPTACGEGTAEGPSPSCRVTGEDGEAAVALGVGSVVEALHPEDPARRARAAVDLAARLAGRLEVALPGDARFPEATVGGRVVDGAGRGVAGATVDAVPDPENRALPGSDLSVPVATTTEPDGTFLLVADHGVRYALRARAEGRVSQERRGVTAPAAGVELVVDEDVVLTGTVTEASSGEPIPSFVVVVTAPRGAVERSTVAVEPTVSPRSEFAIPGLPEGPHRVTVVADGHAPSDDYEVTLTPPATQLTASLSPGGMVRGRLSDAESGRPIPRGRVEVEGDLGGGPGMMSPLQSHAITDPEGRFTLSGIGPGPVSLLATAPAYHARAVGGIPVAPRSAPGSVAPVELTLTPLEEGETPAVELVGIGAVLSSREDVLVVGDVVEGGGAAAAGLTPGDEILAVDGAPIADLGFAGAVQRIRGPEGSRVVLEVRREGTEPQPVRVVVPRLPIRAR